MHYIDIIPQTNCASVLGSVPFCLPASLRQVRLFMFFVAILCGLCACAPRMLAFTSRHTTAPIVCKMRSIPPSAVNSMIYYDIVEYCKLPWTSRSNNIFFLPRPEESLAKKANNICYFIGLVSVCDLYVYSNCWLPVHTQLPINTTIIQLSKSHPLSDYESHAQ